MAVGSCFQDGICTNVGVKNGALSVDVRLNDVGMGALQTDVMCAPTLAGTNPTTLRTAMLMDQDQSNWSRSWASGIRFPATPDGINGRPGQAVSENPGVTVHNSTGLSAYVRFFITVRFSYTMAPDDTPFNTSKMLSGALLQLVLRTAKEPAATANPGWSGWVAPLSSSYQDITYWSNQRTAHLQHIGSQTLAAGEHFYCQGALEVQQHPDVSNTSNPAFRSIAIRTDVDMISMRRP